MKFLNILEYLRSNTGTMKRIFFIALGFLVVLDIFIPRENTHYLVDRIPAFWTFFTLAGCYLLIKISKGIAHMFLAKDEDYYD